MKLLSLLLPVFTLAILMTGFTGHSVEAKSSDDSPSFKMVNMERKGLYLLGQGNYEEAIVIFEQLLKEVEEGLGFGQNHPFAANIRELIDLSKQNKESIIAIDPQIKKYQDRCLYILRIKDEDIVRAERMAKLLVKKTEKKYGKEDTRTGLAYRTLGMIYGEQKKYHEEEKAYSKALVALAEDPEYRIEAELGLAVVFFLQDKFNEAEPFIQQALKTVETLKGPGANTMRAMVKRVAADIYESQGSRGKSEKLYGQALKETGDDPELKLEFQIDRAKALFGNKRYSEAEKILRETQPEAREIFGPDSVKFADISYYLARVLLAKNKINKGAGANAGKEVEVLLRQALSIQKEKLGEANADTVRTRAYLGRVMLDTCDFEEAEAVLRPALSITLSELEKNSLNPEYAVVVIGNFGQALCAQAKYKNAVVFFEKAYGIITDRKETNILTPVILANYALALEGLGKYAQAETKLREALSIHTRAKGKDMDILAPMNSLALLLMKQGRSSEALKVLDECIEIAGDSGKAPDREPMYVATLVNSGLLFLKLGKYQSAAELFWTAIDRIEKTGSHGKLKEFQSDAYGNLSIALQRQGKLIEAERTGFKSFQIAESCYAPDHPKIASGLHNVGFLMEKTGNLKKAADFLNKAYIMSTKNREPENLVTHGAHLAEVLVKQGRLLEALAIYIRALDTLDTLFSQTRGNQDQHRIQFLNQFSYIYASTIGLLVRLHEEAPSKGYDREAFAVTSRMQSKIFSELLRQSDVQSFGKDPLFLKLQENRESLLAGIMAIRLKSHSLTTDNRDYEASAEDLKKKLDSATRQLVQAEKQLWDAYPRFMELNAPKPVTVSDLQKKILDSKEALLTYALLRDRTIIFAVTESSFQMRSVPIPRKAVLSLTQKVRAGAEKVASGEPLDVLFSLEPADLFSLYHNLFAPLEKVIEDKKTIIVIGDGPIYTIPFEMLVLRWGPGEKAAFQTTRSNSTGSETNPIFHEYAMLPYLGEKYRFKYYPSLSVLSSKRIYPRPKIDFTQDLVAFADPIFHREKSLEKTEYSENTKNTLGLLARSLVVVPEGKEGSALLPRLPETADEAIEIADALGESHTNLYLGEKAQEYLVKTIDLSLARYLVFSTHGLLGGEFIMVNDEDSNPLINDPISDYAPVRQFGQPALALTLVGDLKGEDGFLTMKEVIENLRLNSDLVVLSACNTAGETAEARNGEGFAGLTRAFMYAGTKGLIVSHWSVESESTKNLMVDAFKYMASGKPPIEALGLSRKNLKNSSFSAGRRTRSLRIEKTGDTEMVISRSHPYYWAPFVFIGD